jgi:DNA-binding XRE family transcriptional regulator
MSVVLAAVDTTDVARPVLETAIQIGHLMRSRVEALYIRRWPMRKLFATTLRRNESKPGQSEGLLLLLLVARGTNGPSYLFEPGPSW